MRDKLTITLILFAIISLIAIFITVHDKNAARHSKFRVSEKTLMLISALGGSLAMYITMKVIHHKTKKKKFMIGIPVIIVLQLIILIYFLIHSL